MDDAMTFENETDLMFALLAQDPFAFGIPAEWYGCEFDVALEDVQNEIRNYYFVDS
jgi:hypothetical protein